MTQDELNNYIIEQIKPIVEAAVLAEREACAKVCEKSGSEPSSLWDETGCWIHASLDCAAAIRARGEK